MKTVNLYAKAAHRSLALCLGGALLCLAAGAQAQNDPSGPWDFVISGSHQQGVAFLTFEKDQSINGFEVITSYTPPPSSTEGRDGDNGGRQIGSGGSSNVFFFGFTGISGTWHFDSKGRTIGFINEGQDSSDVAQSASFVATVKPGSRMTMKLTDSPNPAILDFKPRNRVFKGIPLEPTDDVSGAFYADAVKNTTNASQKFIEFFSLANITDAIAGDPTLVTNFPFVTNIVGDASANAYFFSGSGPGYTNFGVALFSAQKKLGIASVQVDSFGSNAILRSVSGSFNVGSGVNGAGRLFGVDDDSDRISYKVKRF